MSNSLYLGRIDWPMTPVPELPLGCNEVATRALITHGDKVLLVWQSNFSQWWLPGGRIKPGENLRDGLVREIEEETGEDVTLGDLVGFFDAIVPDRSKGCNKHMFHFIFAAEAVNAPSFSQRDHVDTDPDGPSVGTVTRVGWFTLAELQGMDNVFPALVKDWPSLLTPRAKSYFGTKNEDGAPAQFEVERFYISARTVTQHDDKILLVRNHNSDWWYGAGGRIELGEALLDAAVRELAEETGQIGNAHGVIAVDEFFSHTGKIHQINLYTVCILPALKPFVQRANDYVAEARLFSRHELAALPRAFPAYMAELAWPNLMKETA